MPLAYMELRIRKIYQILRAFKKTQMHGEESD
jgi:hypothetical protein